jgi:hypothetical protein
LLVDSRNQAPSIIPIGLFVLPTLTEKYSFENSKQTILSHEGSPNENPTSLSRKSYFFDFSHITKNNQHPKFGIS